MGISSGSIRAGGAVVEISTDQTKLDRGLAQSSKKLTAWGRAASRMGRELARTGLVMQAPLIAAAKIYASLGAEIARGAQRASTSVESFSALKYAADQNGVAVEALEKALDRMSRKVGDAAKGNRQAVSTFAQLGLSVGDLLRMNPEQKIGAISDALGKIQSPDVRNSLAENIFGRNFGELLPLFRLGSSGIQRVTQHARELGAVMSNQDAQAALQFDQRLRDLWTVVQFGAFRIGGELAPAIGDAIGRIISATHATAAFVHEHQGLAVGALKAAVAMTALGLAGIVLGKVFGGLAVTIKALRLVGPLLAVITNPWVVGILVLVGAVGMLLYKLGLLQNALGAMRGWLSGLGGGIAGAFGGSGGDGGGGSEGGITPTVPLSRGQLQAMKDGYAAAKNGTFGSYARQLISGPGAAVNADREAVRQQRMRAAHERLERNRAMLAQLRAQDASQSLEPSAGLDLKGAAGARAARMRSLEAQIARDSDIAEFGTIEKGRVEREKFNDTEGTRRRLNRERSSLSGSYLSGLLFSVYAKQQMDEATRRNVLKDAYANPRIGRELDRAGGAGAFHSASVLAEVRKAHAEKLAKEMKPLTDSAASAWNDDFGNAGGGTFTASLGAFNKAAFGLSAPGGRGGRDGVEKNTREMVGILKDIKKNTSGKGGDGIRLN